MAGEYRRFSSHVRSARRLQLSQRDWQPRGWVVAPVVHSRIPQLLPWCILRLFRNMVDGLQMVLEGRPLRAMQRAIKERATELHSLHCSINEEGPTSVEIPTQVGHVVGSARSWRTPPKTTCLAYRSGDDDMLSAPHQSVWSQTMTTLALANLGINAHCAGGAIVAASISATRSLVPEGRRQAGRAMAARGAAAFAMPLDGAPA